MWNKIQYGNMKKVHNFDAIKNKLIAHNIDIPDNSGWMDMIKLLEEWQIKK